MAPLAWLRGQSLLVHSSCSRSAYSNCWEPSGHWLSALCPSTKWRATIVLSHKLTKLNASKTRVIGWPPLHIKAWPLSTVSPQSLFPKFSDFTSSWRSREASSSKSISYPDKQVTGLISTLFWKPWIFTGDRKPHRRKPLDLRLMHQPLQCPPSFTSSPPARFPWSHTLKPLWHFSSASLFHPGTTITEVSSWDHYHWCFMGAEAHSSFS